MEIKRTGTQPPQPAPSDWFTGKATIQPIHQAADPARVVITSVTFSPGARTNWHTHPLGQTILITAGTAWVQRDGGPIEVARTGDTVWFPPEEKHWHGAAPNTPMTHIAIQERLNGSTVTWLEPVTDQQYQR